MNTILIVTSLVSIGILLWKYLTLKKNYKLLKEVYYENEQVSRISKLEFKGLQSRLENTLKELNTVKEELQKEKEKSEAQIEMSKPMPNISKTPKRKRNNS